MGREWLPYQPEAPLILPPLLRPPNAHAAVTVEVTAPAPSRRRAKMPQSLQFLLVTVRLAVTLWVCRRHVDSAMTSIATSRCPWTPGETRGSAHRLAERSDTAGSVGAVSGCMRGRVRGRASASTAVARSLAGSTCSAPMHATARGNAARRRTVSARPWRSRPPSRIA
jgi:hypothetical protein